MSQKNLFITLNNVVRDIKSEFLKQYEQYLEEYHESSNDNLERYDLTNTGYQDKNFDLSTATLITNNNEFLNNIKLPPQSNILWEVDDIKFETVEDFEEFLFSTHAFEIFGRANELSKNAMNHFNELVAKLSYLAKGKITVSVLSLERDISKPATLFFLSKYSFGGSNIKFVYDYSEIWKSADAIITANPYLLQQVPQNKTAIKIGKKDSESLSTFENIETLVDNIDTLKELIECIQKNN